MACWLRLILVPPPCGKRGHCSCLSNRALGNCPDAGTHREQRGVFGDRCESGGQPGRQPRPGRPLAGASLSPIPLPAGKISGLAEGRITGYTPYCSSSSPAPPPAFFQNIIIKPLKSNTGPEKHKFSVTASFMLPPERDNSKHNGRLMLRRSNVIHTHSHGLKSELSFSQGVLIHSSCGRIV